MKKFLFAAIAFSFFITSCSSPSPEDCTTEEEKTNLAASEKIMEAFRDNKPELLDQYFAEDFVDHTETGDKVGIDSLKATMAFLHQNLSNMKLNVLKRWAKDDHVAEWIQYTGTSKGAAGMPAGPMEVRGVELTRYKDGKAVEHWFYYDSQMEAFYEDEMPEADDRSLEQRSDG